jgi:hypothetical protein
LGFKDKEWNSSLAQANTGGEAGCSGADDEYLSICNQ